MLVKPYVPNDKLEGSSVVNSVIDKLFVECFNGVSAYFGPLQTKINSSVRICHNLMLKIA